MAWEQTALSAIPKPSSERCGASTDTDRTIADQLQCSIALLIDHTNAIVTRDLN